MSEVVLKVKGLTKSFDAGVAAVKDVSFEVEKGKILTLFGESGCGKSTLLKMISGFLEPDAGRVYINDKKLPYPSEILIPGDPNIEIVKQDYDLFPNHKVDEVLHYKLRKYIDEYIEERTVELLEYCGLLEHRKRIVKTLSGGQQQRLAIAQALADEPDVILLDEPFNSLDSAKRRELRELVKKVVAAYDLSVVMVTHDVEDVFSLSDDLIVLKQGEAISQGNPIELYTNPKKHYVGELLGELNYFSDSKNLAIRPEDLFINGDTLDVSLKGLVEEVNFTGSHYRYIILEDKKKWIVYSTIHFDLDSIVTINYSNSKLISF